MKNFLINKLVWCSKQKRTPLFRFMTCLIGGSFIAVVLPYLFIKFGQLVEQFMMTPWHPVTNILIASISITVGLSLIGWVIVFHVKMGRGSPAHCAPTQKLVTTGPYKLCRNPMQLGGIFYFLGVGTLFASVTTGIICAGLVYILGAFYHKQVEEKELEERFGDDYRQYKKNTPFIFPRLWKK